MVNPTSLKSSSSFDRLVNRSFGGRQFQNFAPKKRKPKIKKAKGIAKTGSQQIVVVVRGQSQRPTSRTRPAPRRSQFTSVRAARQAYRAGRTAAPVIKGGAVVAYRGGKAVAGLARRGVGFLRRKKAVKDATAPKTKSIYGKGQSYGSFD